MRLTLLSFLLGTWLCSGQINLPRYTVNTFAGSVPLGDGGPAASAILRWPGAVAFDSAGNLLIVDQGNASIRRVTPDGIIHTVAGTGTTGFSGDGGPANQAQLSSLITALAINGNGNIYIADSGNNRIRMISAVDGRIRTVVDGAKLPGSPEMQFGFNGIAIDGDGSLYIADDNYDQIFKIGQDGTLTVVAGTGESGDTGDGGPATNATFENLWSVYVDAKGTIYVSDAGSNRIRMITSDGTINAVAGTGESGFAGDGGPAILAQLNSPSYIVPDAGGNLYFVDDGNTRIRRIATDGTITTVAGKNNPNGFSMGDGGPATDAQFTYPQGIALSAAGDLFIADFDSAIRVVSASDGIVRNAYGQPHFAGDGGPAATALFTLPQSFAGDGKGNFYIGDSNNFRVRKVDASGTITTIAGNGAFGNSGDGGPATGASLEAVLAITVDNAGNIYFSSGPTVRRIGGDGIITTVAGGGSSLGDGGPATAANLASSIYGLAADNSGSLYIADTWHHRIRRVTPDGMISTFAGTGMAGYSGDNGPATSAQMATPRGLAMDAAGNLYFADLAANRVRKISPDGIVSAFAGSGQAEDTGDGGSAIKANLTNPWGLGIDQTGNVYIADWATSTVRVVTPDGLIHTIASGNPVDLPSNGSFSGDGGQAIGADYCGTVALGFDGSGKVYLLDFGNERIRVLTPNQ